VIIEDHEIEREIYKLAMLCGIEFWPLRNNFTKKMSIPEMVILRWISWPWSCLHKEGKKRGIGGHMLSNECIHKF